MFGIVKNRKPIFNETLSKIHPKGKAKTLNIKRVDNESILIRPARILSSTFECNKLYINVILIPKVIDANKKNGKNHTLCVSPRTITMI